MGNPIIAIGLDSADPDLIDGWIQSGHLKNLKQLRERGTYKPLSAIPVAAAEAGWTTVLSGVLPERTGFWSQLRLNDGEYDVSYVGSYDYEEFPPFYALGDKFRVAAIDIPQVRLSDDVNGVQVLGYGAHSPQTPRHSIPAEVLPELIRKYGDHPAYEKDHALLWKTGQMERLTQRLITGIERRAKICVDMLQEQSWDLFLAIFGEIHSAGHFLYHISRADHPMHAVYKDALGQGRDPMLEVAEAIDRALGDIMEAAPRDASIIVFSQEGLNPNNLDLTSMVFLPELLYRYCFPGQIGIGGGGQSINEAPPPMIERPLSLGWTRATWSTKHDDNKFRSFLRRNLPMEIGYLIDKATGGPAIPDLPHKSTWAHWMAPLWWRPVWHDMKAFALPSFSLGYVHLNVTGRDIEGHIEPSDYDAVCEELIEHILALRNPRTGNPVALEVKRTRTVETLHDPKLGDADLVVMWSDEPADVVDSPTFGRIGPVPHRRSSGHNDKAFMIAAGPDVGSAKSGLNGRTVDVAATILSLMGAPVPKYMDSTPLFEKSLELAE